MSTVKREIEEEATPSFFVRQSCTPKPQRSVQDSQETSSCIALLLEKLDQVSSDLTAARRKMTAMTREMEAMEAGIEYTSIVVVSAAQEVKDLHERLRASGGALMQLVPSAATPREEGDEVMHPQREDQHQAHDNSNRDPQNTRKTSLKMSNEEADQSDDESSDSEENLDFDEARVDGRRRGISTTDRDGRADQLPFPFSHRPCPITSSPAPAIPEYIITFAELLQRRQRARRMFPRTYEVEEWILKEKADFFDQSNVTNLDQFVPIAQQYLDLVLEGPLKYFSMHFKDVDQPWLVEPRTNVPDCDTQIEELCRWEEVILPSLAPEVFYPLVDVLSEKKIGLQGITFRLLTVKLRTLGQHLQKRQRPKQRLPIRKQRPMRVEFLFQVASQWCNIEIFKVADGARHIRLTDMSEPFKEKAYNDRYFCRHYVQKRQASYLKSSQVEQSQQGAGAEQLLDITHATAVAVKRGLDEVGDDEEDGRKKKRAIEG